MLQIFTKSIKRRTAYATGIYMMWPSRKCSFSFMSGCCIGHILEDRIAPVFKEACHPMQILSVASR